MRQRGRSIAEALRGAWRVEPPVDLLAPQRWAEIAPLLLHSGAGALGWWKLRNGPQESSGAAQSLKDAYRTQVLLTAHQSREVRALLDALPGEPLLGKGIAVGRYYGTAGLRPVGDIDLYVRPGQHPAASAALAARPEAPNVDLHRGFSQLDDRDADALYLRSQVVTLGGQRVRVLGDEDHLRLLCLHALGHGAWRPSWFCDLAAIVEGRRLDWDLVLAGDRRRADWIACALGVTAELLGATLDDAPPALRGRALPPWLIDTILEEWGRPYHFRQPIGTLLRRPKELAAELWSRWPNGVEATVGLRGPFNDVPRLPFQLGECARRVGKFVAQLAAVR